MSYLYAPSNPPTRLPPPRHQVSGPQIVEPHRQPRANTPERFRERQVPGIPEPYSHTPRDEDFYMHDPTDGRTKPNSELLRDHLFNEGRLTEEQALFIIDSATRCMSREPNILNLSGPVTVCGDTHGQFYDLMKAFEIGGSFSETNYLFLGNYVNHGAFGIECLLYLYTLKLWCPSALSLLRGSHECRYVTDLYTFRQECLHKYSERIYEACVRSFEALPLTALVDGKFFAVHGGISPHLDKISDIGQIDRFMEPPSSGLLCDLLWADPFPHYGNENLPPITYNPADPRARGFFPNGARGRSYSYTYSAVCAFLQRNDLRGIFRGHEVQDAGYTIHRQTTAFNFPSLITVFSAPDHLDVHSNKGAMIKYKHKNITIRQFHASPHPYCLPDFMNAVTWSLPFVASNLVDMLHAFLNVCTPEELSDTASDYAGEYYDAQLSDDDEEEEAAREQRREEIRSKILAVGRMQRVFQMLREEAESVPKAAITPPPPPPPLSSDLLGIVRAGAGTNGTQDGRRAPRSRRPPLPAMPDALGLPSNVVRRQIYSSSDTRSAGMADERPRCVPLATHVVPAPNARLPRRASYQDADADEGAPPQGVVGLLRHALEAEGLEDGGLVERIAERIATGRPVRPKGLKRFEIAP